ncbi:hypothetical protein AB0D04_15020 [Streptomyces sp. NPDC048483]|uniref:hypothetical protein n=1 Tax=Streptomyces sp. NPDC048483 TaxID=3154927 RepID=UPI0034252663
MEDALAVALRILGDGASGAPLEFPGSVGEAHGEVRREARRRGGHGFALRNVGSSTAFGVRADPDGLGAIARNLPEDATVWPEARAVAAG